MSAALQVPAIWAVSNSPLPRRPNDGVDQRASAALQANKPAVNKRADAPLISVAFYRKHTESTLRRYLYASMQVGKSPSILGDPVGRGWASSRPVRTFEDAIIFVLDVENCLKELGSLDRQLLCRIVVQEYTQVEAASLLGMSVRTVSYKFPMALDRLTDKLLQAGLLVLPN